MATSQEKNEAQSEEKGREKNSDKELETEMPLSEKDEVKKAEHQTNKGAEKNL